MLYLVGYCVTPSTLLIGQGSKHGSCRQIPTPAIQGGAPCHPPFTIEVTSAICHFKNCSFKAAFADLLQFCFFIFG